MNRKIYFISMLALFSIFLFPFSVHGQTEGKSLTGDGSAGNPYEISSAAELKTFCDLVTNGNYSANGTLMSDITIDENWVPIGGDSEATAYAGVFTGNGYSVIFSQKDDTKTFQGLFSCNVGTIRNVTVKGTLSGSEYVGGIAAVNRGTIQDCHNKAELSVSSPVGFAGGIAGINYGSIQKATNTGNVFSASSGSCIGGIVGAAYKGSVHQTFNSGTITLFPDSFSDTYTEGCTGGIVGLNYAATISTSGNSGQISSEDANGYTGGVTGLNNGSVDNCYNTASISGVYYTGGIAGYNFLNEQGGKAILHNNLNVGSIRSDQNNYGSICGINEDGSIYDNYYKEGTALAGVGSADNKGTLSKSEQELSSGEVTYLLNGNQSSDPVWYQTISSDMYPLLDSSHGIVYQHQSDNGSFIYTNDASEHKEHTFDEHGECTICHYKSVALAGHSMTLDGAIGVNYYYYIDPMYYNDDSYQIQVQFTINGRTEKDTFDIKDILSTNDASNRQAYGFQLFIRSDEMTSPIADTLTIMHDGDTIVSFSANENYRAYDYINTLYTDENASEELKKMAQGLATYDYYANEYFRHFDHYEPEIPLLSLNSVDMETLKAFTQTTEDESNYSAKYYGNSLNLLSKTAMSFFISSPEKLNVNTLYLGYKTHGSTEDYTYTKAKTYGSYYQGTTGHVPSSELNVLWDVAFFIKQDNGTYKQITALKTAGPLSYINGILDTSTNKNMHNLAKALYLYYQTADAFFQSLR